MSEQRTLGGVPELTLGWRMKMALAHGDVTVHDMADELGMSRGQISRYLNDHGTAPRRAVLIAWALRCGVPLPWLEHGTTGESDPGGQESSLTKWYGADVIDFGARRVAPTLLAA